MTGSSMPEPEGPVLVFACTGDDPLGQVFLPQLAERGVAVVRVDPEEAALVGGYGDRSAYLGGFSRGARLAARVANDLTPMGLVLLGYPFHPKGRPRERQALEVLAQVRAPSLVLQGERDLYGNRQVIRGVSPRVRIEWLADGNHRFVPRAAAGTTQRQLIEQAVGLACGFMGRPA